MPPSSAWTLDNLDRVDPLLMSLSGLVFGLIREPMRSNWCGERCLKGVSANQIRALASTLGELMASLPSRLSVRRPLVSADSALYLLLILRLALWSSYLSETGPMHYGRYSPQAQVQLAR